MLHPVEGVHSHGAGGGEKGKTFEVSLEVMPLPRSITISQGEGRVVTGLTDVSTSPSLPSFRCRSGSRAGTHKRPRTMSKAQVRGRQIELFPVCSRAGKAKPQPSTMTNRNPAHSGRVAERLKAALSKSVIPEMVS